MGKTKILDKIKKCLALSKSSNANEAATALRHAQALMRQHGITEADVEALGFSGEKVDIPVQSGTGKKLPLHIGEFVYLMRKAFGVRSVISEEVRISDASYVVSYFGPTARVMMAAYAHQVCWRAMTRAWTEHLKENPRLRGVRGMRTGFYSGWIEEVSSKVQAIGFTEEEEAKTELVINQTYGKKLVKMKTRQTSVYGSAEDAGRAAGSSFNIHRPVNAEKLRLT